MNSQISNYFIVLLLCLHLSLGQSYKCRTSFGLFTDPQRCTHYYECENFMPTSKECGSGLLFNPKIGQCDWPAGVDQSVCSKRKNSPIVSAGQRNIANVSNFNHITFICHADGLYEDPVSCEHFVECSNGSPFRKICPAGLHFDIRINACNWPDSMACTRNHGQPLTTSRPRPTNTPIIISGVTTGYTGDYVTPPKYNEEPGEVVTSPPPQRQTPRPATPKPVNNNNCEWCFKCPSKTGSAYLMYCPRDSSWIQRKRICETENASLFNKHENDKPQVDKPTNNDQGNRNPFTDDDSGDDGAGLIDSRMQNKKKSANRTTSGSTRKANNTTRKPKTNM